MFQHSIARPAILIFLKPHTWQKFFGKTDKIMKVLSIKKKGTHMNTIEKYLEHLL
jgi:hypothetical protein